MRKLTEQGGIELIEEATHLLRLAPAGAFLSYYLGSLPFFLGVLYFWSDMSRSAFAAQRLPLAALGLALLLVWMKTWQAVFAHQLLARLCGEPPPRWSAARLGRMALVQGIVQPSGLFVLPVAFVLMAPFGWLYAFYQNLTALAGTEHASVRGLLRKSWRQACLWPGQNHAVLMVLPLFGLVAFLNLFVAVAAVPWLLDLLLDVQTPFTQSPWAILNSTFFAAVAGLTHLCLDPLLKAVYVLRCFRGESLQSAADLKADLRRLVPPLNSAAAGLALLLALAAAPPLSAADQAEDAAPATPPPRSVQRPPPGAAVTPAELDRSIDRALDGREFLWRLPREHAPKQETDRGWLAALLEDLGESLKRGAEAIGRWIEKVSSWIRQRLSPGLKPNPTPGDWTGPLPVLLTVLIAVLVGVLGWLLFRMWQTQRRQAASVAAAAAPAPAPDVADDTVGADQLPEDGWVRLARELWERGELRLALRALYLSSLAHLAARDLISLARFKSNLDYERELGRRAHALPELLGVFRENVSVFDQVWYGLHEVNPDRLGQFAQNVERIKAQ
jgi:hypothetical protein